MRRPGRTVLPAPPRAGDVLARADGLRVRLGSRPVLGGVGLDVAAGQVLALVGPNGAGKSTLLGALAGDVPAAGGGVLVGGAPAGDRSARQLALRRAVLPQSAPLAFPFTAGDVVRMGRAPWAGAALADEDEPAVAEAMAATETAGFADRPFPALSGGERARVALARVLAQRAVCCGSTNPPPRWICTTGSRCCGSAGGRPAAGARSWSSCTTSGSPPHTPTGWRCSPTAALRRTARRRTC